MRPQSTDSPRLGVVVPVKALDESALATLAAHARAAPRIELVAVGRLLARGLEAPGNLAIVDRDCGLYEAMNAGLAHSRAKHLLFMGIDDRLLVENVPAVIDALAHVPASPLIALPLMLGARRVSIRPRIAPPVAFHHQGVLFAREAVLQLGGYSGAYRLHSDLDLMFRMQRLAPAGWIDVPLVEFRRGGVSTSGASAMLSMREFSRIYRAHGVSRIERGYLASMAYLVWFRIRYLLSGAPRRR